MRAALIAEGSSDRGFTDVLARLCRRLGVTEVEIEETTELLSRWGSTATIEAKISTLLRADPEFDLLFVHRDADKAGLDARREEIHAGNRGAGEPWPLVKVIPIREMEAWLLVDKDKLREVVGNPPGKGKAPLGLPKISHVEACGDPKARLRAALDAARHEARGKKKRIPMTSKEFSQYRAQLLADLDIKGNVTQLSAWQALVLELQNVLVESGLCRAQ